MSYVKAFILCFLFIALKTKSRQKVDFFFNYFSLLSSFLKKKKNSLKINLKRNINMKMCFDI